MRQLGILHLKGGAEHRPPARSARRSFGPIAVLVASLLGAFPAVASAFTAKPLLGGTSATPSSNGATLHATIYPYGLDTHYHFEYGPTTSYGTSVPMPEGDAGAAEYPTTVQEQAMISGLTSGATYHYRVVASNSDGSVSSGDAEFTTTGTPPSVEDEAAVEVSGGFELKGHVNPNGFATTYQFEYGPTTAYGSKIPLGEESVGSGTTAVAVSQTLTGLLANATYHFRLLARGAGNAVVTSDRSFTTPPPPPSAPSAEAGAPQATAGGYLLKGAVNPDGLETGYHFEFGTSTSYGKNLPEPDAKIGSGSSPVQVMQEVTGLLPNTTYHYRIVATNSDGPGHSADEFFTTPPPKPTVTSLPVSESAEGFTLNGTVNPNGGATTYEFEFGITEAYGEDIPAAEESVGAGTSPVSVSQLVKGLPPGVPYHYRLVAHNAGGTSIGEDEFFLTPSEAEEEVPKREEKPGGGMVPPTLTPPSNAFSAHATPTRAGKATLSVQLPGPGTVSVSGRQIKSVQASATRAGTLSLTLKLTTAAKQALRRAHRRTLRVKVTIVFSPTGGSPGAAHQMIAFK